MKKITSSIILSSVLVMSTGCVSDTLALHVPTSKTEPSNNSEVQTKSNIKTSKVDTKMKELDVKTENKIDRAIDKFFNKL
jgi:hypothetical protein